MALLVSLSPDVVDFELIQNDTFSVVIDVTDDTGAPIDLTGASVKMQVRTEPSAVGTVVDISDGAGIVLNASIGQIIPTFTLPSGVRRYSYDVQITHSSGLVETTLRGSIIVISDTTR